MENINRSYYVKLFKFCTAENNANKFNGQATDWEKIFAAYKTKDKYPPNIKSFHKLIKHQLYNRNIVKRCKQAILFIRGFLIQSQCCATITTMQIPEHFIIPISNPFLSTPSPLQPLIYILHKSTIYINQGSPTPGPQTSTGPRPVRNQATQQEVSSGRASKASPAVPYSSPSLTLLPEPVLTLPSEPSPHPRSTEKLSSTKPVPGA